MRLKLKKKLAIKILLIALILTTLDALVTNWMISRMPEVSNPELNPLLIKIAGTPWLIIIKSGWVALFLIPIIFIKKDIVISKRSEKWCDLHNGL
jgi:hypothetical protein